MKKNLSITISVVIFLFLINFSFASENHDDSDHSHRERFGDGRAILKVDDNKGFLLSPEAFKSLGIKTISIKRIDQIPNNAIVTMRDKKGIYILREGFFRFIALKDKVKFLKIEQVVVSGQNLLLVTDVFSTDEAEYSH